MLLPGFEETFLWRAKSSPTDFAWLPTNDTDDDGGQVLLVTLQNGEVWMLIDGVMNNKGEDDAPLLVQESLVLDLKDVACNFVERGLLSVAVHPQFARNSFVYLFYTFKKYGSCGESANDGPVNRLSRFKIRREKNNNTIIDRNSELVLFDTLPLPGNFRNVGCVRFGKDGYVYVTTGDAGYGNSSLNNITTIPVSQDPSNLFGKVIRITDSGDIPDDNPFASDKTASVRCHANGLATPPGMKCQEVLALGLRNPFRFSMDPNTDTVRFFINDPGGEKYEEIDEGKAGRAPNGVAINYGWPIREGPCVFQSDDNDCTPDSNYTDPIYWYQHQSSVGAITAGTFIPSDAMMWPDSFSGSYLYVDWMFGEFYSLQKSSTNGCRTCNPPTSNYTKIKFAGDSDQDRKEAVSMAFGPYYGTNNNNSQQALYYLVRTAYGDALFDGLYRIAFVGSDTDSSSILQDAMLMMAQSSWIIVGVAVIAGTAVLGVMVNARRRRQRQWQQQALEYGNLELTEGQHRDDTESMPVFRDDDDDQNYYENSII